MLYSLQILVLVIQPHPLPLDRHDVEPIRRQRPLWIGCSTVLDYHNNIKDPRLPSGRWYSEHANAAVTLSRKCMRDLSPRARLPAIFVLFLCAFLHCSMLTD